MHPTMRYSIFLLIMMIGSRSGNSAITVNFVVISATDIEPFHRLSASGRTVSEKTYDTIMTLLIRTYPNAFSNINHYTVEVLREDQEAVSQCEATTDRVIPVFSEYFYSHPEIFSSNSTRCRTVLLSGGKSLVPAVNLQVSKVLMHIALTLKCSRL